jgi:tetratricopeptide (TPR) repeat protein
MFSGRTRKPGESVPAKAASLEHLVQEARKLHRAGHLVDAARAYREVLEKEPRHFESLRLLGVIESQLGNHADAIQNLEAVLKLNPNSAEAFNSHGNALKRMGRLHDALVSYDQAVALDPSSEGAFNNRGLALHELARVDEALKSFDQAIALNPGNASAHNSRANTLKDMQRLEEALVSYDLAIALRPDYADALKNRGTVLQEMRRLDEALESYDRAIGLRPDYAEALNNRGSALCHLKRIDEALANYDRAIALNPGFANAFLNRAMARLLDGRFREGWSDYEWRWQANGAPTRPVIDAPVWEGEDLAGRRIAVYAEQGLGDVIQFARYLPLLVRRGAAVTFLASPKLVRLLRPLSSEIEVVASTERSCSFDFQCALLSLPLRLGTELSTIPGEIPYLRAEEHLVERWARELGGDGFKIGIAWQGKREQAINLGRSIPLSEFAALCQVPDVRLISLQKGDGLEQLLHLPPSLKLETLASFDEGPDAFVDTAAVMENLDLIITSDTAVAHLAGALGRPTWIALKSVPDWRWLLDRADSPWYPTIRLFRQETEGDWNSVFSRMREELRSQIGRTRLRQ